MLTCRINARSPASICGRPPKERDFRRQLAAKARAVPVDKRLGTDDVENLKNRWKPAVKQHKEPAIIVGKPDATMEPAPQNNQLMPKHRVFSLQP
jgi:hypothetical protein